MKFKSAFVFAAAIISLSANAESIIVGGFSHHLGKDTYTHHGEKRGLNEVNPTLGIESNDWSAIVMKNSYYKPSVAISHNFNYHVNDVLFAGVKVGVVTGYNNTPVDLAVAPLIQFETGFTVKKVTTVVGFIPPVTDSSRGVFTIHWKVKM